MAVDIEGCLLHCVICALCNSSSADCNPAHSAVGVYFCFHISTVLHHCTVAVSLCMELRQLDVADRDTHVEFFVMFLSY